MKFRSVPAIITLLAAFVSSVVMISRRYSLFDFLLVLVTVLVVFYIAGLFLRFILNVVFKEQEKDKDDADEDGTVTESEADEKEEKKSKDRKK
ncbi:MAG: hypothetical protein IJB96_07585 [Lachnospira sp.]|nr:hypothetical protein [Lachnospira sp.]